MFTRRTLSLSLVISLTLLQALPLATIAQNSDRDDDIRARIRKEGMEHSQIMKTMHMLTDVYGPRLTGSPNHKRAAEWTIKQMQEWGLENGHLEPWDFKHPGWLNERLTAHIISPVKDALVCEVLGLDTQHSWHSARKAYQLILPERPTQEQLTAFFERRREMCAGELFWSANTSRSA